MYPVNPVYGEVLGPRCYPSLADLPEVPEIVDVFQRREELAQRRRQRHRHRRRSDVVPLGLCHDEAAATAPDAGLDVVQDRRSKIEQA